MSQDAPRSASFDELLETLSPNAAARLAQSRPGTVVIEDQPSPAPLWYLVVVPFDDLPEVKKYDTVEELTVALRGYLEGGEDIQCFPIYGIMGQMSEGQFPHFIHPNGTAYPLYDSAQTLKTNADYFLGDREELSIKIGDDNEPTTKVVKPAVRPQAIDEPEEPTADADSQWERLADDATPTEIRIAAETVVDDNVSEEEPG